MKVTEKDVAYVAELANLELTDDERNGMVRDLNSILDYIDRLNELDTSNVPPQISAGLSGPGAGSRPGSFPWREDERVPCLPRADALGNAPATDGEFFKVPRVIEK